MAEEEVRRTLRERIARGATLDEIDLLITMSRGLSERQRASLWAYAWGYAPARRSEPRFPPRPLAAGEQRPRLH